MEVKKPGDLEGQPLDKTLATPPEKEKPSSLSLHPKSVTREGCADEIPSKTVAGGERKSEKPQGSDAGPLLSPTAAAAAKAAAAGVVTDLQKKLLRAERFRMPVQLSEEEKRNSRAERFGMGSPLHEKSEEMKRKARAERFGTGGPSLDDEAKKKARIIRFGTDTKLSSVEEEKRKARAARFSQPITTGAPSQGNGNADEHEGGT